MRGFEKGPRSCIGQELALVEMRVILVLLMRRFDFTVGYDALDRLLGRQPPSFEIGRAYTVLETSVQPKDGIPLIVKERHL
jgi:cytochrome P450